MDNSRNAAKTPAVASEKSIAAVAAVRAHVPLALLPASCEVQRTCPETGRLMQCGTCLQDDMNLQVAWLAASMTEHEQCKVRQLHTSTCCTVL